MPEPPDLPGCTPEPLMGYLKTLGVFRLVAKQADPDAKLSWVGGHARLDTVLDRDRLTDFFLNCYRPTPVVGPWGARSGFYPGGSESSARQAIEAISTSTDPRLEPFRATIEAVRGILARLNIREKGDLDHGDNYIRLLRDLRNELPGEVGYWLDGVYSVVDERKFPPLLGTGGNEGSGSYMSNFCQTVADLLIDRSADAGVEAALYGTPAAVRRRVTVGHFDPGAIGGPNSAVGFDGGGGANPWDFLLAIEGTLLFRSAPARRLGTDTAGKAAFPFTVDPNPVGYGSAAGAEDVRAEIWMPEWSEAIGLPELEYLLSEGRAQFGRRQRQARNAVEFARAAVTLGVSRGLTAFHRYAFSKRNGLSYFAAYLGRFPVREVPKARLVDDLDGLLGPYRRMAEGDKTPPRFAAAVRRIDAAIFDVCRYGGAPHYMQAVLRAIGRAERELANGPKVREDSPSLKPLAGLKSDWLSACDDGSPEYRLAASLAFMPGVQDGHRPMRMYLEPVVRAGNAGWKFDDKAKGIVWSNADLPTNLAAILNRRLRDGAAYLLRPRGDGASQQDDEQVRRNHPLRAANRFRPALADVLQFLEGNTDDDKLADFLWALPAINPGGRNFRFRSIDLRLIASADAVDVLPAEGSDLVIIATVQDKLYFRIFDADGEMSIDTDETQFPDRASQIAGLRSLLDGLWSRSSISPSERGRVISAVTSIVDPIPSRWPDSVRVDYVPADFAALRLSLLSEPVARPRPESAGVHWAEPEVVVRNEPRLVALVSAERLDEAVEIACRRLYASGLPPYLTAPVAGFMKPVRGLPTTPTRARRLAGALLFPLRPGAIRQIVRLSIRESAPEP